MNKKKFLIFFFIILIILGCTNNKKKNQTPSNNTTTVKTYTVPDGQIGIVSHKLTSMWCVEAIIKNNTNKNLDYVAITATSWDKDGNNLGTATGSQRNINTLDNYKINIYCPSGTTKYTLSLKYE